MQWISKIHFEKVRQFGLRIAEQLPACMNVCQQLSFHHLLYPECVFVLLFLTIRNMPTAILKFLRWNCCTCITFWTQNMAEKKHHQCVETLVRFSLSTDLTQAVSQGSDYLADRCLRHQLLMTFCRVYSSKSNVLVSNCQLILYDFFSLFHMF